MLMPACFLYLFPAWLNGAFQSGVGTGVVGNEKVPTRSLLILTSGSSYDSSAVLVPNAVNVHFMTLYDSPPPSNDSHHVGNQREYLWSTTLDMSERCGQRTVYRGQPFLRSKNFISIPPWFSLPSWITRLEALPVDKGQKSGFPLIEA